MARRSIGPGLAAALAASAACNAQTAPPPEPQPQDVRDAAAMLAAAPVAVLSRGGLRVEVALPDAKTGFYRGTRFDWSGQISLVTLGTHRFYGPWFDGVAPNLRDFADDGTRLIAGPQTGATGPAEEFVAQGNNPTPGYAEAPVGGSFLKIGVGRLLKADNAPYNRFRSYRIVGGTDWTIRRQSDRIRFHQQLPADASGYGYDYEKTVRIEPGHVLVITHRLRNTGTKPIVTEVYSHNFARFDGGEIGPDVRVRFPYTIEGTPSSATLAAVEGQTLRYLKPLGTDHLTLNIAGFTADPATSGFTVFGGPDGASVHAQADAPLSHLLLWSIRRVVAVEPFIAIDLAPGAEKSWSWRYSFDDGGAAR